MNPPARAVLLSLIACATARAADPVVYMMEGPRGFELALALHDRLWGRPILLAVGPTEGPLIPIVIDDCASSGPEPSAMPTPPPTAVWPKEASYADACGRPCETSMYRRFVEHPDKLGLPNTPIESGMFSPKPPPDSCGRPSRWSLLLPSGRLARDGARYRQVSARIGSFQLAYTDGGVEVLSATGALLAEGRQVKNLDKPGPWPFEGGNGNWRYLASNGQLVGPELKTARRFHEGWAAVQCLDGRWGYQKPDGTLAIACSFDGARDRSEGLAAVAEGGRWGAIDESGHWAVSPRYADIGAFFGGVAIFAGRAASQSSEGRYGVIDRAGLEVVPPAWADLRHLLESGTLEGRHPLTSKWIELDRRAQPLPAPSPPPREVARWHLGRLMPFEEEGMTSTNYAIISVELQLSTTRSGVAVFVDNLDWLTCDRDAAKVGRAIQDRRVIPYSISVDKLQTTHVPLFPNRVHAFLLKQYAGDVSTLFAGDNLVWQGDLTITSAWSQSLHIGP